MMDYNSKVREVFPHASTMAGALGINDSGDNGPGAEWLFRIRDYYDWDEVMESDEPEEFFPFGDPVEVSTYQQWLIFTDLQLWRYDADVTYSEQAEFTDHK